MPEPRFRAATPADAADMAVLTDIAGEGLPVRLWLSRAASGQSALEIARARALRNEGAFTYRNAQLATVGGAVVGMMLGYPLVGDVHLSDVPPIARPLVELEAEAPGHWYVNILGVYAEFRGQGIGSRLLAIADELGRRTSPRGMAIIVASENVGAWRLYDRHGYREAARRTVVPIPGGPPSPELVLLTKPHG